MPECPNRISQGYCSAATTCVSAPRGESVLRWLFVCRAPRRVLSPPDPVPVGKARAGMFLAELTSRHRKVVPGAVPIRGGNCSAAGLCSLHHA